MTVWMRSLRKTRVVEEVNRFHLFSAQRESPGSSMLRDSAYDTLQSPPGAIGQSQAVPCNRALDSKSSPTHLELRKWARLHLAVSKSILQCS